MWGEHLTAGFAKGGRERSALAVSPTVQVAIDGDLETARAGARMRMTLYLGGMGSKKFNFYGELARRMGFGTVADDVQELFLAGEKEKAFDAVPDELLDRVCLLGDERAVGEGLAALRRRGRRPGDRDPRPRRPGRAVAHDLAPRRAGGRRPLTRRLAAPLVHVGAGYRLASAGGVRSQPCRVLRHMDGQLDTERDHDPTQRNPPARPCLALTRQR